MVPHHRVSAQFNPSPYTLHVKRDNDKFRVTLEAQPGGFFRGFLLRVRFNGSAYLRGSFVLADPEQKIVDCKGIEAVTHRSNATKVRIATTWRPAPRHKDSVIFVATVVRTKEEFWLNVRSEESPLLQVKPRAASTSLTCKDPEGCLSLPRGCPGSQPCLALYQVSRFGGWFEFEVSRELRGSADVWVAGSLAHQKGMKNLSLGSRLRARVQRRWSTQGPAHVLECFSFRGLAEGREGYNNDKYQSQVSNANSRGLRMMWASASDGVLSCAWLRDPVSTFLGMSFDIKNQKLFLAVAMGNLIAGSKDKDRHLDRTFTEDAVNLTHPGVLAGQEQHEVLVKLHGTLMIFAWLILATFGMTVARHFKLVWAPTKMCDLDIWFVVHRSVMMTSVAVQLSAFLAIFTYVGYTFRWATPHAVFGMGTLVLAVMQVLVAFVRPGHDSPRRPAFCFFHHTLAQVLYTFAVVTVALAVPVPRANLMWSVSFLVVAQTSAIILFAVNRLLSMHAELPEGSDETRVLEDKRYRNHILAGFVLGQGVLAGLLMFWVIIA